VDIKASFDEIDTSVLPALKDAVAKKIRPERQVAAIGSACVSVESM
jgi:hypothetical protein